MTNRFDNTVIHSDRARENEWRMTVFGSTVLDVAIGLVFVYLLLSLICSAITEGIARVFAMRSGTLKEGIRNLLSGPGDVDYAQKLYDHPLISGLYRQGL